MANIFNVMAMVLFYFFFASQPIQEVVLNMPEPVLESSVNKMNNWDHLIAKKSV